MRTKDSMNKSLFSMILLCMLTEGDSYGYELREKIYQVSGESIDVISSSMYPTLYKLEANGYVSSYQQHGESRKERTYYHMEKPGREYLQHEIENYERSTQGIMKLIAHSKKFINKRPGRKPKKK